MRAPVVDCAISQGVRSTTSGRQGGSGAHSVVEKPASSVLLVFYLDVNQYIRRPLIPGHASRSLYACILMRCGDLPAVGF